MPAFIDSGDMPIFPMAPRKVPQTLDGAVRILPSAHQRHLLNVPRRQRLAVLRAWALTALGLDPVTWGCSSDGWAAQTPPGAAAPHRFRCPLPCTEEAAVFRLVRELEAKGPVPMLAGMTQEG